MTDNRGQITDDISVEPGEQRACMCVCPSDLGLDSGGEGKAVKLHLPLGTCSPEDSVDKWILDWIADEAAAAILGTSSTKSMTSRPQSTSSPI